MLGLEPPPHRPAGRGHPGARGGGAGVSRRCRPPREELAALYAEAGRAPEGIVQLEAIAALEPDRPERQAAVGLAQARAGRTDLAMGVLGRAAERYPDNAVIYVALGRVWFEAAERARDRVGLRKAIEALEPFTRGPRVRAMPRRCTAARWCCQASWREASTMLRRPPTCCRSRPTRCSGSPMPPNASATTRVVRSALERWAAIAPESAPEPARRLRADRRPRHPPRRPGRRCAGVAAGGRPGGVGRVARAAGRSRARRRRHRRREGRGGPWPRSRPPPPGPAGAPAQDSIARSCG